MRRRRATEMKIVSSFACEGSELDRREAVKTSFCTYVKPATLLSVGNKQFSQHSLLPTRQRCEMEKKCEAQIAGMMPKWSSKWVCRQVQGTTLRTPSTRLYRAKHAAQSGP